MLNIKFGLFCGAFLTTLYLKKNGGKQKNSGILKLPGYLFHSKLKRYERKSTQLTH